MNTILQNHGIEDAGEANLHIELRSPYNWDTSTFCSCGEEFKSRAEQWKHAADELREGIRSFITIN